MKKSIAANLFASIVLVGFTMQNLARAEVEQQCDPSKPETTPASRFEINRTDGTAFDTKTKLTWKICAEGQSYADGYCTGDATEFDWDNAVQLFGDNGNSWRLPGVDELGSIVEERCRFPTLNKAIFPDVPKSPSFWSSSPYEHDTDPIHAWFVSVGDNNHAHVCRDIAVVGVLLSNCIGDSPYIHTFDTAYTTMNLYVRLVRGEQWSDPLKQEEREQIYLAQMLRGTQKNDFCDDYGKAIRGEELGESGVLAPDVAIKLVKAEARRRKLVFNDTQIKKGLVRIGMSECQLYAAMGLPNEQNRTVGKWGVHIQHIYGGTYVYTENGRVTSWQD